MEKTRLEDANEALRLFKILVSKVEPVKIYKTDGSFETKLALHAYTCYESVDFIETQLQRYSDLLISKE